MRIIKEFLMATVVAGLSLTFGANAVAAMLISPAQPRAFESVQLLVDLSFNTGVTVRPSVTMVGNKITVLAQLGGSFVGLKHSESEYAVRRVLRHALSHFTSRLLTPLAWTTRGT